MQNALNILEHQEDYLKVNVTWDTHYLPQYINALSDHLFAYWNNTNYDICALSFLATDVETNEPPLLVYW